MTLERVYELIPELELEQNEILRSKCALVWKEAFELGNWEEKGVNNCTTALGIVRDDCPEKALSHCRRVVRVCKAVYEEIGEWANKVCYLNYDILIAGALLHDVGKFLEYDYRDGRSCSSKNGLMFRHCVSGAYLAKKHDLPDSVVHMVLCHSNAQSPEGANALQTPELTVLKYCDHMCSMIVFPFYGV